MARVRATCKAMTAGENRGKARRLGEDLAESELTTHAPAEPGPPPPIVTQVKTRIFSDGSGLFEFSRGRDRFSIRWTEEEKPVEVFANFDGVEGILVPIDYEPFSATRKTASE